VSSLSLRETRWPTCCDATPKLQLCTHTDACTQLRLPSAAAGPPIEKLPPPITVDREKTCPLLLRVFPKRGGHHKCVSLHMCADLGSALGSDQQGAANVHPQALLQQHRGSPCLPVVHDRSCRHSTPELLLLLLLLLAHQVG
jgi:hypothetical protein